MPEIRVYQDRDEKFMHVKDLIIYITNKYGEDKTARQIIKDITWCLYNE